MAPRCVTGYLLTPEVAKFRTVKLSDDPSKGPDPFEQMRRLVGSDRPAMIRLLNVAGADLIVYFDQDTALHPAAAVIRVINAKTSIAGPVLVLRCDGLPSDHPDASTFGVTPHLSIADVSRLFTVFKPLVVPRGEGGSERVAGFNVKMVEIIPAIST